MLIVIGSVLVLDLSEVDSQRSALRLSGLLVGDGQVGNLFDLRVDLFVQQVFSLFRVHLGSFQKVYAGFSYQLPGIVHGNDTASNLMLTETGSVRCFTDRRVSVWKRTYTRDQWNRARRL